MVYTRELTAAELTALLASDTANLPVIALNNATKVSVLVVFGQGCTAGAVALKVAPARTFAGTWEERFFAPCPGTVPPANGAVVTATGDIVGAFVRPELKTALAGGTITKVVIYAA
jgi:hypothetical protein